MQLANVLNRAQVWPELPENARYKALPGRPVVLMCPEPEKYGELVLPDYLAGNLRPDAGVIAAIHAVDGLEVGTRVYLRPYVGLFVQTEEGWYRMVGRERFADEDTLSNVCWSEHIVAFEDGTPTPGNVKIHRKEQESIILQLENWSDRVDILSGEHQGKQAIWKYSDQALQFGDDLIVPECEIEVLYE